MQTCDAAAVDCLALGSCSGGISPVHDSAPERVLNRTEADTRTGCTTAVHPQVLRISAVRDRPVKLQEIHKLTGDLIYGLTRLTAEIVYTAR